MNYYVDSGTCPGGKDYSAFMTAWSDVYNAVEDNDNIYMYWSPNVDTSSEPVAPWWPGASQVDIVSMDYYPNADEGLPTFDSAYGDFYNTYAADYGLSFAIGETGTQLIDGSSASVAQREYWLKAVINPSDGFRDYPLYMSATWFEYGLPTNSITYYMVYDQSKATVTQTISNTETGST